VTVDTQGEQKNTCISVASRRNQRRTRADLDVILSGKNVLAGEKSASWSNSVMKAIAKSFSWRKMRKSTSRLLAKLHYIPMLTEDPIQVQMREL
jgi:hypothetical protein